MCYRNSVRFEELVGQEQATAVLRRALAGDRLAHAYLFEGPAGVGKRSAAVALGMDLNCERSRTGACGACETCRRIAAGLHPDVMTIVAEGAQIVMEQAQQIVALGAQRPHEARARVIIVDDADRLNANASNCLLKTLEEPLRGTHLVLVTAAPDKLLGTIRSRAQRIRFRRVSEAALQAWGAARGVEAGRAAVAAVLADGSVARFLELTRAGESAGEGEDAPASSVLPATAGLRAAARDRGIAPILDAAAEVGNKESKQQLPEALALLARLYRDAMVTAAGAPELAVLAGDPEVAALLPTNLRLPQLGRALEAIVEADTALLGNVNATMALERLLLALRREERLAS